LILYFCFVLAGNMYCHIANIATFDGSGKDPLITNDEEDSDKEDDIIKADDNLILFGHVEGDASILEVFGLYSIN